MGVHRTISIVALASIAGCAGTPSADPERRWLSAAPSADEVVSAARADEVCEYAQPLGSRLYKRRCGPRVDPEEQARAARAMLVPRTGPPMPEPGVRPPDP